MKRNILVLAVFMLLFGSFGWAQSYYVAVKTLNFRTQPNTSAEIISKLSYCDNITFVANSSTEGWIKVKHNGNTGFVSKRLVKKGRCIKDSYSVRVGARCNDGTRSSATGRGACSHHGGVNYWITKTYTDYRIEKDSP